MANTFTQIYLQFVFAVQNRTSLIQPDSRRPRFAGNVMSVIRATSCKAARKNFFSMILIQDNVFLACAMKDIRN
jgi:hypothetical protein